MEENSKKQSRLEVVRGYLDEVYQMGTLLRYDTLSRKVQVLAPSSLDEMAWRDITDRDINSITMECSIRAKQNISAQDVNLVLHSDYIAAVHPLREWLSHCPAYDPRLGDLIDQLADQVRVVAAEPLRAGNSGIDADSQTLWRDCFKRWFVAMVASWLNDDVVNHQVLVLIGRQGIYKTTWLEHLIPPELRQYLTKLSSSKELSKDDRIRVAEFGLINMDEIDAMSSRELNVMKSVITTTDVNERAAYGYTKERRIRCASFCASGNNREFLSDDTGNRRWLPFEVESIENPWGRFENWDYIYGQALYLIRNGFHYWFDQTENDRMEEHKHAFEVPRGEEDMLEAYFRPATAEDANDAKFLSAAQIQGKLVTFGSIRYPMPLNKFGEVLRKHGFLLRRTHGRRGYDVVEIPASDEQEESRRYLTSVVSPIVSPGDMETPSKDEPVLF